MRRWSGKRSAGRQGVTTDRCIAGGAKVADNKGYTCNDYREEMILLSLRKRLHEEALTDDEKKALTREIEQLEARMDMA